MTKKAKRDFLKKEIMTSKNFWRTVKPFFANNGSISNYFIGMENEGKLICNEQELVEVFNEHSINVVEKSSGKRTLPLGSSSDGS